MTHFQNNTHPRMNRRAILAGAAAAAVPVPALALPDPVFAAIEKHREAHAAFEAAVAVANELEESVSFDIRREPRVVVWEERELVSSLEETEDADGGKSMVYRSKYTDKLTGKLHYAHDRAGIENSAPRKLSEVARETWIAERWAALCADGDALWKKLEATGLPALRAREDAACGAADEALSALSATVPTTLAGIRELLRYLIACKEGGEVFHQTLHQTLLAALEGL